MLSCSSECGSLDGHLWSKGDRSESLTHNGRTRRALSHWVAVLHGSVISVGLQRNIAQRVDGYAARSPPLSPGKNVTAT
jgi:hypothetical protein